MSEPSREASPGGGREVTLILPPLVAEKIGEAAKERGETVADWCAATLIKRVAGRSVAAGVPPEELSFDVRMALAKAPATKGMDELALRLVADRVVQHLAQARLVFVRGAPFPLRPGATAPETAVGDGSP